MEHGDLDFTTATASQLLFALANRRITASALCEAAIARIEAKDAAINAVVVRDFDAARAAAREADAELATGARRPLLGLPMTVKESFDVAGLPTTWGLAEHRGNRVQDDAVAVARLRRAGAVILGKTNVAPALADYQANNPVYGRTANPLDLTRSPGGSSGGSSAALAAGYVSLELGSDIAGSIRVPAAFCGVFGHKPSYDLVPLRGHAFPGSDGATVELGVVGPMARSADDLTLALDVLAGPDLDGARAYQLRLPPPRHERLKDYRVLLLDQHPMVATASEIRDAIGALADELGRAGVKVARQSALLPDLGAAHAVYMKIFLTITTRGPLPNGHVVTAAEWLDLHDERARIVRRAARLFADFDVVIAPAFGSIAFPHLSPERNPPRKLTIDGVETDYHQQFAWPGFASLAGLPATAMPIATSREGLPIGVQMIGPYLEDRTPITFASEIEALRAGQHG